MRYLANLRRRKNLGFGAHTVVVKQRPWKPKSHRDPASLVAWAVFFLAALITLILYR